MPRPNQDRVAITVYLPREHRDTLGRLAKHYGVPIADIIRAMVALGLSAHEDDEVVSR